jgi:hypothetical protein
MNYSYSYETMSGLKPYTHTNIARIIVNGLIVGKLEKISKEFKANITDSY